MPHSSTATSRTFPSNNERGGKRTVHGKRPAGFTWQPSEARATDDPENAQTPDSDSEDASEVAEDQDDEDDDGTVDAAKVSVAIASAR
ncbi:hypothetical protein A5634_21590 [Mycobacterium asiaticum]|uniref:Uncharacterized protein n=2 Tax=Mycobacterium asiaticum TaxID=1790 RepID=A0A1A3P188_MYCAS|nr:hypothetical protein A5634_21590 [Mycobacterium asiaticum]